MHKSYLTLSALFFSLALFSQANFVKGAYTDSNGVVYTGYIKNMEWRKPPKKFLFKENPADQEVSVSTEHLESLELFEIDKFIKRSFQLDISETKIDKLDGNPNPVFVEKTALLRVLVEGEASLYQYIDTETSRFYLSVNDQELIPLIYKEYYKDQRTLTYNKAYLATLWDHLKCDDISMGKIESLRYTKKDLKRIVSDFNSCKDPQALKTFDDKKTKDVLKLHIKAGAGYSFFDMVNHSDFAAPVSAETEKKIHPRIGVEFEYYINYRNKGWSVYLSPTYQSYTTKTPLLGYDDFEINYQSVEIPLGIRKHFYLSETTALMIDAGMVADIPFNSYFIDPDYYWMPEVEKRINFSAGFGFRFKDWFSFHYQWQAPRDLARFSNWGTYYKAMSFMLAYSVW